MHFCQRVIFPTDKGKLIRTERNLLKLAAPCLIFHKPYILLVFYNSLYNIPGILNRNLNLTFPVFFLKFPDHLGQNRIPDCNTGTNMQF